MIDGRKDTQALGPLFLARAYGAAPWLVVLSLSLAFRLPALINAAGTNSDAAIVGLQAMHLLRGEWSPFLWGSGYQTSVDSAVAAALFALGGPSPLLLTLSSLGGHLALTGLAFAALRRSLSRWTTAALVMPLVFTPGPVHTYVLFPPRQASLTLAFLGLFLLHGAPASRRPRVLLGAGAFVASLAVYADPYALLFLPAAGLLGLLALDPQTSLSAHAKGAGGSTIPAVAPLTRRAEIAWRTLAFAGGGLLGMIPYRLLVRSPLATRGQTSLTLEAVPRNLHRLTEDCLPWLLSTKVFRAEHLADFRLWETGPLVTTLQWLGAVTLMIGILSGGVLFFYAAIPRQIRCLGLVGATVLPVTIGGFLVSPMVMDLFSSRYLAAILLATPFALAPAAYLLQARRFTLVILPYLVSAALSGWVSYQPFGLSRHPSLAVDDALGAALRERGIHYAVADYWASYRLTFLYRESPVVVPTNLGEDRYRPYRSAFEAEPRVAYVHDAYRSRERLEETERQIVEGKTGFEERYERFVVGNYTVLLLRRRPAERVAAR